MDRIVVAFYKTFQNSVFWNRFASKANYDESNKYAKKRVGKDYLP